MSKVTRPFQAEVKELLDLVIHSLYSNRDIFLRELISNASDALDKLRFAAHSQEGLLEGEDRYRIRLLADPEAGTLTISDSGIGMSLAEVEENIGTIAKSGTKAFLQGMKDAAGAPELIGQFGVGFYAAFMVADRVTLHTRRAGEPGSGCRWESAGDGSYTLEESPKAERGTEVVLHLREEQKGYLQEWKLRELVRTYSDFVQYPVLLPVTRTERPTGADGQPIEGVEPVTRTEEAQLNSMKAIWTRPKSEVSAEEYAEFYHHVSHDPEAPLKTIHYAAEGVSEFRALLFIPAKKPFDFLWHERRRGLQLYVRRVFITDRCDALLPDYLRFVQGVVESSDLPLNVSRELLQEEAELRRIRTNLVGKLLATLTEMKEQSKEEYVAFFREFGAILKEGVHSDYVNREKLAELLLFESSRTAPGEYVSLAEYLERMVEGQSAVYFQTGSSRAMLDNAPQLEALRAKGCEVLYLTDPVDEWVVQGLTSYQEKPLQPADRGELPLGGEGEQAAQEVAAASESYGPLLDYLREKLGEKVAEVRFTTRLTESACCLVAAEGSVSANLERILKAFRPDEALPSKRVLELNPQHALVEAMQRLLEKDRDNPRLADYAELVYDQALLTEGSPLPDPVRFTRLLSELMVAAAPDA